MKPALIILLFLTTPGPLVAQQPTITKLVADEAKSLLQIRGQFGTVTGSVLIADTTLDVVSWSDSLIVCNLPDSGRGAGGNVTVKTQDAISNERFLSVFKLDVFHSDWYFANGGNNPKGYFSWSIAFRADIGSYLGSDSLQVFEASKVSYGSALDPITSESRKVNWEDTAAHQTSGIAVSGVLNKYSRTIKLIAGMQFDNPFGAAHYSSSGYATKPFTYDTLGNIFGYWDFITIGGGMQADQNYVSGKILFPPSMINTVVVSPPKDDQIRLTRDRHSIKIHSSCDLGKTTILLYSVNGTLLSHDIVNLAVGGEYTIDVKSISAQEGFVVLQTEKGLICRKIIL
ncbi:MAG: hypothetical protein JSS75_02695 [Bacteroidetes bacterium]|nr:hypothetical protein [Bacteroidota bacterium]